MNIKSIRVFCKKNINSISFIFALLLSHLIWKILFYDDFDKCRWDSNILNVTDLMNNYCGLIAIIVNKYLKYFNLNYTLVGNVFYFSNYHALGVVWGCSAIKQMMTFVIGLLIAKGNIIYKLAYLVLGLTLVFCINIFRIFFLAYISAHHPEIFYLMHEYLLKYLFYMIIFFFWSLWVEVLLPKYIKNARIQNAKKLA